MNIQQLTIQHQKTNRPILDQLSLSIQKGEIISLVGASGSGKSLLAQAIFNLLPKSLQQTGEIYYQENLLTEKTVKSLRGKEIVLIPQSLEALDPLMTVGKQMKALIKKGDKEHYLQKIINQLGLRTELLKKYPFELSGGQARRVLVAIALASEANLVIADEPTPGLDEHALRDMLQLLTTFRTENRALLMITHDFQAAREISDYIAVLYQGEIVEVAPVTAFSGKGVHLKHAYTKQLWRSLPENDFTTVNNRLR